MIGLFSQKRLAYLDSIETVDGLLGKRIEWPNITLMIRPNNSKRMYASSMLQAGIV